MNHIDTMKLALSALKDADRYLDLAGYTVRKDIEDAIAALQAALAEPSEVDALRAKNTNLVCALDRIHDVLNGVYVDDVAAIVNKAINENRA